MIKRNDPCPCGSKKKYKKCCLLNISKMYLRKYGIIIKEKKDIEGIKKASIIAADILDKLCKMAKEGITTNELDLYSKKLHSENNAIPAPLGYGKPPFPKTICTSLNEVICHGIPDDRPLQKGDILNIDVTSIFQGYYGDCSRMVIIGDIEEEKKRVVDTSYKCLKEAISICKPGIKIYEIANVIEYHAKKNNCSVVNQYVGHGVGINFHEPPQIPHHYNNIQIPLVEGMTFTIEPMINAGKREAVVDPIDHWTVRTIDKKPSAQWEHTILITSSGHEILTKLPEN